MSDNNYQEVIKNNKLFDGIPPQDLKFKFSNEQIIRKKEGEIIFQKGDESRNTYLIIAGRVKIKVYIENKSVKLNKSINDFFGEIEVLEDTYRRSAAVANTDCILYTLSKQDLRVFIAENSEINDNIIAYNKVEIPELQITIRHGFLKEDTDKLYLLPRPEENEDKELPDSTDLEGGDTIITEETESDEASKEIPAVEEEIYEDLPDEIKEDTVIPSETADFTKSTVTEVHAESNLDEEESVTDVITEEKEEPAENIAPAEFLAEEDSDESGIENDTDNSEEILRAKESQQEVNQKENPKENIFHDESINETIEADNFPEETESVEEFVNNSKNETMAENQLSEDQSDLLSPRLQNSEDTGDKWIDLNSTGSDEEIPDADSDEEKFRFDAAEEKLKYDDTQINLERILEAVIKINSSFDKHTVFSNIIREAVKLTEAQAGILYRTDLSKNLLVTEQETDDGYMDVGYSFSGGLTGLAAETGEIINVRDPVKDFRFSEDIDSIIGLVGSSILCVPVKNDDGDTIAVITLANSSSGKFSISDEERISQFVPHVSHTLQFLSGVDKLLDENKNTYLSTLTKFITDNIKTPVLTMKYYAGQIKKKSVPQEVRTVLNVLMDQSDSVVDFLHSTLAFTENRNTLQIEKCSLQEVMDDSLGLLAEYVESRNVGLYKKVENNLNVRLDKKAFYQACHQIAKNACDAMGESGNIYITAKQSGDLVNIEFRDTGPGIPDELKEQIFQPFKSYNKEGGTGLGLSIAQQIIRDHGGELTVESKPEQGATFVISLPVFDEI